MISSFHIPDEPLSKFISSFYYFEGFMPEHAIDIFLPNGETEIIIDLTDSPKCIYERETLKEIQVCQKFWVSGVRTEPICIPSGKDSKMIIVNFRKGGAHPFYPFPLSELTDCVVDADLIFGSGIKRLREQLLDAVTPSSKFKILESFMFELGRDKMNENVSQACTTYMVNSLVSNPSLQSLHQISHQIGFSHKHLIDLFRKNVGVNPKLYMRILRFQHAIIEIEANNNVDWLEVAYSCGYYDQSHFIRDFRRFSGITPSSYLDKKSDTLNYVPFN